MEDVRYRVVDPANGKFQHFTTLNNMMNHFTGRELISMMKNEESSATKTDIAVVLNSEVVGYVSMSKVFNNLFKPEHLEG